MSGRGPHIDVWYGPEQRFGTIGVPQHWINIVGNVSDPAGVASLTYSFDGTGNYPLTIGPDRSRLVAPGDFNLALDLTDVPVGASTVTLHTVNTAGDASDETVRIQVEAAGVWPLPYAADWSAGPTAAGEVVDGKWEVAAQGIRTAQPGYDRVIAIGGTGWHDYRLTVPFIVDAFPNKDAADIAAAIGWTGHDLSEGDQAPLRGHPFGALCDYFRPTSAGRMSLRILANGDKSVAQVPSPVAFRVGRAYVMAFENRTTADGQASYSCKIWVSGQPEPKNWQVAKTLEARDGSMLLVANNADVTFGNVSVMALS